jgi:hypothetical protein
MKNDIIKNAIAANIHALSQLLEDAMLRSCEAGEAINQGEQNQAIGGLLDLDQKLQDALALYRAAVALHRTGRQS